jgi:DAACS family dicarboxylate/amino acid:cation (Na+ or H+) symporter
MTLAPARKSTLNPLTWPLYARVFLGVVLGAALGWFCGTDAIHVGGVSLGITTQDLGALGLLVVRLLTTLAAPLIFFAILDAFVRTDISGRQGLRLIAICLVNVAVAFAVGLTIMNWFTPGEHWRGKMDDLRATLGAEDEITLQPARSPLKSLDDAVPASLVAPFAENRILSIVLLGILGGMAVRAVRRRQASSGEDTIATVERFITAGYQVLMQILLWLVELVPLAVLGGMAMVIGASQDDAEEVFRLLGVYLAAMSAGLAIHCLLYYPLTAWFLGRKPPWVYLVRGADAVVTGFSANSSLATVPVTLRCLTEGMGVSESSARLSACVGTNFNNDGITLYEAMTALFVAQAFGIDLSLPEQLGVVLASLLASVGVAGLPGSGLIILQLVLKAAGLPDHAILIAFPLIQAVDWILARVRSAVNVLGDMQVAILLDRGHPEGAIHECPPARAVSADRGV